MTAPTQGAELARRLLEETREELLRADGKASLLLAAVGVIAGAVITGFVATSVSPLDLKESVQWLFWLGALLVGGGVAGLGTAVWPRIGAPREGRVHYFGDVLGYKGNLDGLRAALVDGDGEHIERDACQLHDLAVIVHTKYRAIRWGMGLTAAGGLCCLVAWVVNAAV